MNLCVRVCETQENGCDLEILLLDAQREVLCVVDMCRLDINQLCHVDEYK